MSPAAKRRKAALAALGVLLLAAADGYGQELRRYEETVLLAADGSAAVRVVLEFRRGGGGLLLLSVRSAALRDVRAKGVELLAPRPVEKGGNHFLALAPPAGAAAAEVAFTVDGYFRAGGRPGPFNTRKLEYRFVNVSFAAVERFSVDLVLPTGRVFNALGRFVPEPERQGMVIPFAIVRRDGRLAGRIVLEGLGLGDEVALECTTRPARRSRWLLLALAALALAYLVFFRDVLRERRSGRSGG